LGATMRAPTRIILSFVGVALLVLVAISIATKTFNRSLGTNPKVTVPDATPLVTVAPPRASVGTGIIPAETIFSDPTLPAGSKDLLIRPAANSCVDIQADKLTPSHYEVHSTQQVGTGGFYPLLHLVGVAGRTVRIDLAGAPFDKWGCPSLQFAYLKDLNAVSGYESIGEPGRIARPKTGDKPALADTAGQSWHYLENVWKENGRLCILQKFEEDEVYISHRVPYTPGYNQAFLTSLRPNPNVEIVDVGKSAHGRPLTLAKIPRSTATAPEAGKPCILIYAREHADEQDSSWVAQGALEYLSSSDEQARKLTEGCTFIIIPLFDPDGAAAGAHENITSSFTQGSETPESLAYSSWFKNWINGGGRLDLVLNIHNPPPSSAFHVACPMMESAEARLRLCEQVHAEIRNELLASKFLVRNTPWTRGTLPDRLAGWLSRSFGTLVLPYEVNSVTPRRHINLAELRQMGRIMAVAAAHHVMKNNTLMAEVDKVRLIRQAQFTNVGSQYTSPNTTALRLLLR
jgi:hypothetical protein